MSSGVIAVWPYEASPSRQTGQPNACAGVTRKGCRAGTRINSKPHRAVVVLIRRASAYTLLYAPEVATCMYYTKTTGRRNQSSILEQTRNHLRSRRRHHRGHPAKTFPRSFLVGG